MRLFSVLLILFLVATAIGVGLITAAPVALGDWIRQPSRTSTDLAAVQFLGETTGFAGGDGGVLLFTTVGGLDWVILLTGVTARIEAIHFFDGARGWIAGSNGLLRSTTNGGLNWQPVTTLMPVDLHALSFVAPDRGWAAGDNGTLYHYNGNQWQPQTLPVSSHLYEVLFLDAQRGWAAGANGVILHTTTVVPSGSSRHSGAAPRPLRPGFSPGPGRLCGRCRRHPPAHDERRSHLATAFERRQHRPV